MRRRTSSRRNERRLIWGTESCGGEVVVLGTRLLSGCAHGCCLLNLNEEQEQKEVLEAIFDEEKESEVDGERGRRESHSTCA